MKQDLKTVPIEIPGASRLKPILLADIGSLPQRQPLIKGLLGAGEFSVWFGQPGCGKSFLLLHTAFCIARGKPWLENRKLVQGLAIYIAAEGGSGVCKRLKAYCIRHDLEEKGVPLAIIPSTLDLLRVDTGDVDLLIRQVKGLEEELGQPCTLLVIDTLSRTLAGGNENAPDDMGAFIANCDHIREQTEAHVAVVHHSPKSENLTPRGHSSLLGAADVCVKVEKIGKTNAATVEKNKDDEDGWKVGFRLEIEETGIDEENEPITSCVVVEAEAPSKTKRPLNARQIRAKEAALAALIDHGKPAPNDKDYPPGAIVIEEKLLKEHFFSAGILSKDSANPRVDYRRLKDMLSNKDIIREWEGLLWAVKNDN